MSAELVEKRFSLGTGCGVETVGDGAATQLQALFGAITAGFDAAPAAGAEVIAGVLQSVLKVAQIALLQWQRIPQDGLRVGDGIARWQCTPAHAGGQQNDGGQHDRQQLRDQGAEHGRRFGSGDHRTIRLNPFSRNDLQQRFPHRHHD